MDPALIGISIGLGLPFFFLYSRKKDWLNPTKVYLLNTIICFTGLILALLIQNREYYFVAWCFSCPLAIFFLDRNLKNYSKKKNGRDFILWLRYSDEIDDSIGAENPQVTTLDKVISIIMLISVWGLLVAGAGFFGK